MVVPCYNEQEVLPETSKRLLEKLQSLVLKNKIADNSRIMFVNDGSKDQTWSMIKGLCEENSVFAGVNLSRNRGHQNALLAGMATAVKYADMIVTMDADLQDDVEAIPLMVDYFNKGIDIVFGVRKERKTDTFFKKHTAQAFYRLIRGLGGDIVYNHADFRLMSKRTLQALVSFPERNLFLRGMVSSLGYPSAIVYYNRSPRFAGESKYPFSKMLSFALDGITSFSVRPLRYITYLGLVFILIALLAIVYGICSFVEGTAIPGWTSLLVSLWFIGGAILLACGIIGEYVGKIYKEVKRRPRYFVEKTILPKEKN